ncbi:hypothetical protein M5K25_025064 [Dendrobium thyrsiflorum]|uniref:Uncharacterized protein n=1 Tax=Dendrobium thyrsiflorum TaxID=117978 RepID=A0ABD0U885_DENTH
MSRDEVACMLHCFEKNGIPTTKKLSFCSFHRAPNPDTVLIIHTPSGIFSSKKLLKNNDKKSGSRLIKKDAPLNLVLTNNQSSPSDAARCIAYNKMQNQLRIEMEKRKQEEAKCSLECYGALLSILGEELRECCGEALCHWALDL